jgi:hypothetical protein
MMPHARHLDAGRAPHALGDLSHRVFERGDLLDAFGHLLDRFFVEAEPVDEGRVAAVFLRLGDIGLVRFENFLAVGADARRDRGERGILGGRIGTRDQASGGARRGAQLAHRLFYVDALDVHSRGVNRLIHGPILAQA